MNATFEQHRAKAVRDLLIEEATPRPAARTRRLGAAALVVAGAVGGAALSTAALAATGQLTSTVATPSGEPTPTLPNAVEAPAGTLPGAPVTVLLGATTTLDVGEETTFSLVDRPQGTTHARVYVTPEAGGTITWGTDATGNNPRATWLQGDVGPDHATWYDFPLDSTTDALYFTPSSRFEGVATIQFITQIPTHLGVNENGETYGIEGGPDGSPDLIAVWATAQDGSQVQAYVRTADLEAFSPDHPGQPTSPAQALEWQDERAEAHPNGWDIPAYESDGVTQVGTFPVR